MEIKITRRGLLKGLFAAGTLATFNVPVESKPLTETGTMSFFVKTSKPGTYSLLFLGNKYHFNVNETNEWLHVKISGMSFSRKDFERTTEIGKSYEVPMPIIQLENDNTVGPTAFDLTGVQVEVTKDYKYRKANYFKQIEKYLKSS